MVKLLLEAGADAHARNCNGIGLLSTLMKCRVEKSVVNVLPLLLEAGLDPSPLRELIPATASRLDQVIARFAPQAVAIFQSDKIRQETPLVLPMARARF